MNVARRESGIMCALAGVVLLAFAAMVSAAEPPASAPAAQPFLIGADWPGDASPAAEKMAAAMGLNFARMTGGGYGWAIESHSRKVRQLEEKGIRVLLQLGSHYPSADYFKFKDAYLVDQAGGTGKEDRTVWAITYGKDAWPQYSYAAGDDFKKQMAGDFANYLAAFKERTNIVGVILHNEPGLFWQNDKLYDYNARAVDLYRKWLGTRFGSEQALNERWGTAHDSFAAAAPLHALPPFKERQEIAGMLDWRRFQTQLIADWMKWEVGMAREVLPHKDWTLTTNMAGPLDGWHFRRCDDMLRCTEGMGAVGVDIYPSEWTRKLFGEYTMAMTRGIAAGRPVWVCECQVYDDAHKDLTPQQRGDLLYRDLWTHAAGGAKAIAMWRLTDRGGHCLTRGEANPRTDAVRDFAAQAKWLGLERFNLPPRQVAVVADPDSMLYAGATEDKPQAKGAGVQHNWQGYYAAVRAAGLDADVLFVEQLRGAAVKQYKVLILPSIMMMDEELARRLGSFVEEGGVLIADEEFARLDRWGKPLEKTPGFGLDKVVGEPPAKGEAQAVSFGKGKGFLLARNQGQGFLEGWGRQPLVGAVREALPKPGLAVEAVKITPTLENDEAVQVRGLEPEPSVTGTCLRDDRGRILVILTLPNEQFKALKLTKRLAVTVQGVAKEPKSVVLLAQSGTAGQTGVGASKPRTQWKDGALTVYVDAVTSAAAILIGDDLPGIESLKVPTAGTTVLPSASSADGLNLGAFAKTQPVTIHDAP